jgi:hypothetical protein
MRRFLAALAIGILAAVSAQDSSKAQTAANPKPKAPDSKYTVLSPWADVDPIQLRGISPRLQNLAGKKVGIFHNWKRAAKPVATSITKRLRTMYPDIQITPYDSTLPNVSEIETKYRDNFIAWAKGVDAAILVVGD